MRVRDGLVQRALENWTALNKTLGKMNERELRAALVTEFSNDRRRQFLSRLHSRYTTKRKLRERKKLLMRQPKWPAGL